MKDLLLYVAPFISVPPVSGAALRALHILTQLAQAYEIVLLTYPPHDSPDLIPWCNARSIQVELLTEPPSYQRKTSFFRRLVAAQLPGFASHDPVGITADIERVWHTYGPIHVLYFATQLMGQALLIRTWPSYTIIDLYDVYAQAAREKHQNVSRFRPYYWLYRIEEFRIQRFEMRILKKATRILAVSERDCAFLSRFIHREAISVVPNGVSLPGQCATGGLNTVITVGSFTYEPNFQGAIWFYRSVWPRIRQAIPAARWIVVGNGGERLVSVLEGDKSVTITGLVPSVDPYYENASCAVVPIQVGTGTRLKLLEAMGWALPVVTTRKGAEGIELTDALYIVDEPEPFARAVIDCLQNSELARHRALHAREYVKTKYTWDKIGDDLRQTLGQHVFTP